MSTMQAGVINPVSWRGGLKGIPVLLTFRALRLFPGIHFGQGPKSVRTNGLLAPKTK